MQGQRAPSAEVRPNFVPGAVPLPSPGHAERHASCGARERPSWPLTVPEREGARLLQISRCPLSRRSHVRTLRHRSQAKTPCLCEIRRCDLFLNESRSGPGRRVVPLRSGTVSGQGWPLSSLQGCTCGVSRNAGAARALRRSPAYFPAGSRAPSLSGTRRTTRILRGSGAAVLAAHGPGEGRDAAPANPVVPSLSNWRQRPGRKQVSANSVVLRTLHLFFQRTLRSCGGAFRKKWESRHTRNVRHSSTQSAASGKPQLICADCAWRRAAGV